MRYLSGAFAGTSKNEYKMQENLRLRNLKSRFHFYYQFPNTPKYPVGTGYRKPLGK
jgi:hypothetical protein